MLRGGEVAIYERLPDINASAFIEVFDQLLGNASENTLPGLIAGTADDKSGMADILPAYLSIVPRFLKSIICHSRPCADRGQVVPEDLSGALMKVL